MADYIGGATFAHGLSIVSDVPMISGFARQTLAGEIVTVHLTSWATRDYQTHAIQVAFEWEAASVIRKLDWAWGYGRPVYFRADWLSGKCYMDPGKGVYNLRHIYGEGYRRADYNGTAADGWNGNVQLLVIEGTTYY